MTSKTLEDLRPNPKNPRRIADSKKKMLTKALKRFGDLGGIVFNRKSQQLVGGHQRTEALGHLMPKAKITLDKIYDSPTKQGTVAEGYVELGDVRHSYREVDWDDATEKAANLAANKGAGEFDVPEVADILRELRDFDLDLDETMFDVAERENLLQESDFVPTESEPARLDQKKQTVCPSCGHEF